MIDFVGDHLRAFGAREVAMAVFAAAILLEMTVAGRARGLYRGRDTWANLGMYAGNVLIVAFWTRWMFILYDVVHEHALFADWLGLDGRLAARSPVIPWALLVLLEDLCFYTFHRTSHRCRVLWASHENHHSSPCFNLTVALRQTWTPFLAVVFWVPLAWLGFDPGAILLVQAGSLVYQATTHTQVIRSLGPLDWVMNSPAHHRVHHGADDAYLDKNFGGVFIVWDRLFGTFAKEGASIRYGIDGVDLGNPLRIAFREWHALALDVAREPSHAFGYLFMPPGWRPAPARKV